MPEQPNILLVSASAQQEGSVTRRFAMEMVEELTAQHGPVKIVHRDVSTGLPVVDASWVEANYTPAEQRDAQQQGKLAQSDELVRELQEADILVIATPIYNFSVPASLKAWIDMICRVGLTFNYTSDGAIGLLGNGLRGAKKAYIVMASGGTRIGSEIDFASGYLRHVLGFIGIDDVAFISAERFNHEDQDTIQGIQSRIAQLARQAA
ncbi:MAG: NAD(P)H-dependent oxidoreductase [Thioalkalispiraceae bacterium]|jgi:FMN-dependent NADH-azoreductase